MKRSNFRPRDMLNQDIAGICGVARMTDKARAAHSGEIGSYKYGANSEQDQEILSFLGISEKAFHHAAIRLTNDVKLGHGFWTTVRNHPRKSQNSIAS